MELSVINFTNVCEAGACEKPTRLKPVLRFKGLIVVIALPVMLILMSDEALLLII